MTKIISRTVIIISAVAVTAVLIGSLLTPIQLFTNTLSSIEPQILDGKDLSLTTTDLDSTTTVEEPLHLHLFIDGEGLKPVPEAWASAPDKVFTLIADEDEGQTKLSTLEIHLNCR